MLVTDATRRLLAIKREQRAMTKNGYRKHETDWEILRGVRIGEIIIDAQVSVCGKYVWTKLGPKP
jgi:hypothetical protein